MPRVELSGGVMKLIRTRISRKRPGGRRSSRRYRVPLAAALLALCVLLCLFDAAASAGAAAPGFSHALLVQQGSQPSSLTAAQVFAPLGIPGTQQAANSATPGKPGAKSPKGSVTRTKPTFKWSKAANATRYELRVYKGSTMLLKKTGLTKLSWTSTKALPMHASLTWKVRGSNTHGAGAWSTSLAFKIVSPYAPQGTITSTKPTFKWSKVASATRYELRVYKGSTMLLKKTGLKKLSWKCSKALPMHVNLTWKVRGSKGRTTRAWKSLKFKIVPPATQIAPNAGDAQTAVAGTAVATAPSVVVKDAYNYPVSGVSVTFAVASGGGSVSGPTATTNAAGIATVGGWTLGTHAGPNTLTATSASLTGSPVTFNATGEAGPVDAAQSTITTTSTTVTADGTSNQIITVTARDANGNPLTGGDAVVTITQLSGTATIGTVVNNGDGTYSVTVTAPTTSGTSIFAATLGGGAVDGGGASQALIAVNYVAGPAAQIALSAGDAQTTVAGIAVATAPSVIVTDAHNNPVSGASVTFAVTAGGGGIAGDPTVTTDASGIATVGGWTLGTRGSQHSDGHQRRPDRLAGQLQRHRHGRCGRRDAVDAHPDQRQHHRRRHQHPNVTVQAEDAYGNDLTTGSAIVTISQLSGNGM